MTANFQKLAGAPISVGAWASRPAESLAGEKFALFGAILCLCFSVLPAMSQETETGRNPSLTWQDFPHYRMAPLQVPDSDRVGFQRLDPGQTGLRFTNALSADRLAANQILEVGSGVALGDVDGDTLPDIYLCSMDGPNKLYRNLGGWQFADITEMSGVACPDQFSTGAVLADVDGDDDLDLLVNAIGGGTRLFVNTGTGRFRETANAGLSRAGGSTSMALADVDGDGYLDLYVANYHTNTVKDSGLQEDVRAGYVDGKFVVNRPDLFSPIPMNDGGINLFELGQPDIFYLNDGQGGFVPQSWTGGRFLDDEDRPLAQPPRDWALSVALRDVNGDRAPDLYVCNDFFHSRDQFWINDGQGTFRAPSPYALRQFCMSSMSVDFADLNRDGLTDFFVADMMSRDHERRHRQRGSLVHVNAERPVWEAAYRPEYPRNMLYVQRSDGTFAELAQFAGLEATEWSWGIAFLDVDLDGWEDLLVATGNLRDANDADITRLRAGQLGGADGNAPGGRPSFPPLPASNLAFRNQGDLTFASTGSAWGFDRVGIAHGMALADLDSDGDLDVVVNEMNQALGVYRNESSAPRISIRLRGQAPNTSGIGAHILVEGTTIPRQDQEIMSGGRYLSSDAPHRTFATGKADEALRVEVAWRGGGRTVIDSAVPNAIYEIFEPSPAANPAQTKSSTAPTQTFSTPIFEDIGSKLERYQGETVFDDWERQPSLPRRLSQLGPGVAWYDVDGDGWQDLLTGGSQQQALILYRNVEGKSFQALRRPLSPPRDLTSILATRFDSDRVALMLGLSHYEDGRQEGAGVLQVLPRQGGEEMLAPVEEASAGALSLGVVDRQLALFVGSRVRPGHYPHSSPSRMYLYESNQWHLDPHSTDDFREAGMVSGASWTDWEGDGQLELLLACDWGPIRLYARREGRWIEKTGELGLDRFAGWWNGIAVGDFDNDGRLDMLASNWGRNHRYQRHLHAPLRLYYGDWMHVGRTELLPAYFDKSRQNYVPFTTWDKLQQTCPPLALRFNSFSHYASADITDILVEPAQREAFLEAHWLETTLFLNRGNHAQALPLPGQAQWAPAFGICIGDIDGDSHEDVFLAQNFFGTDPETSRMDSGQGLWLHGDGTGHLRPLSADESGVVLHGEQRGCALSDFDGDGRIDLAVAQHGGPMGLFRNQRGQPGMRVVLHGPSWNPDAIGACVRMRYAQGLGPARLLQAGSGFWSQNSLAQIFSLAGEPSAVQVRWPGGRLTEHPIPLQQNEIHIHSP